MKRLPALFLFFILFLLSASFLSSKAYAAELEIIAPNDIKNQTVFRIHYKNAEKGKCYSLILRPEGKSPLTSASGIAADCYSKDPQGNQSYYSSRILVSESDFAIDPLPAGKYTLRVTGHEETPFGAVLDGAISGQQRTISFEVKKEPPCTASFYPEKDITFATPILVTISNTTQGLDYRVKLASLKTDGTPDLNQPLFNEKKTAVNDKDNLSFWIDLRTINVSGGSYRIFATREPSIQYSTELGCFDNSETSKVIVIGSSVSPEGLCPKFAGTDPNPPLIGDNIFLKFNRRDPGNIVYGINLDNINYILASKEASILIQKFDKEGNHTFTVRAFQDPNDPNEYENPRGTACPDSGGSFTIDSPPNPFPCEEWREMNGKTVIPKGDPKIDNRDYPKKCTVVNTAIGDLEVGSPAAFVKTLFGIVLGLAGGIALLLIIKSGYEFMTSQGNPEKLQAARDTLTSAIVGLLFIILSMVILEVIGVNLLGIPGFK